VVHGSLGLILQTKCLRGRRGIALTGKEPLIGRGAENLLELHRPFGFTPYLHVMGVKGPFHAGDGKSLPY
jgi:hypothetical protein